MIITVNQKLLYLKFNLENANPAKEAIETCPKVVNNATNKLLKKYFVIGRFEKTWLKFSIVIFKLNKLLLLENIASFDVKANIIIAKKGNNMLKAVIIKIMYAIK